MLACADDHIACDDARALTVMVVVFSCFTLELSIVFCGDYYVYGSVCDYKLAMVFIVTVRFCFFINFLCGEICVGCGFSIVCFRTYDRDDDCYDFFDSVILSIYGRQNQSG